MEHARPPLLAIEETPLSEPEAEQRREAIADPVDPAVAAQRGQGEEAARGVEGERPQRGAQEGSGEKRCHLHAPGQREAASFARSSGITLNRSPTTP